MGADQIEEASHAEEDYHVGHALHIEALDDRVEGNAAEQAGGGK